VPTAGRRRSPSTLAIFCRLEPCAVCSIQAGFHRKDPIAAQALVQKRVSTSRLNLREMHARIYLRDACGGLLPRRQPLYIAAVKRQQTVYPAITHRPIPPAGMKVAGADMLLAFDDELRDAKIDLAKTFDTAS